MTRKFYLLLACVLLASSLISLNAMADEDKLSCKGEVAYQGQTYTVRESARTEDKVKLKLIDEACDKVCDALHDAEEDACEKECESKAELKSIECTGSENPKPASRQET